MNADVRWYSAKQLAGFGLRSLPTTERRVRDVVQKEGWQSRQVRSRGGKSGLRSEYSPPPDIQSQIDEAEQRTALYRSDEGLRHAVAESPNPDSAYEAMRRIRDASDALQRLKAEVDYQYSPEWGALLLELLAGGQITEAAARRVIQLLKLSS